jgi:hypothetical protein
MKNVAFQCRVCLSSELEERDSQLSFIVWSHITETSRFQVLHFFIQNFDFFSLYWYHKGKEPLLPQKLQKQTGMHKSQAAKFCMVASSSVC